MKGKKSFLFYTDWYDTFKELPDDKAGQLIKHLLAYVNDENPLNNDLLINAVFANIKSTLKRDLQKWKDKSLKNSNNAKMRWHTNASDGIKRNANNADNDIVNVNDSDNVTDIKSNSLDLIVYPSFKDFWNYYDKKINPKSCRKKWDKIKQSDRELIMEHLKMYVPSTPDKQYRKKPVILSEQRTLER